MIERFTAPADGRLSQAMRGAYARDGFLVLEGFAGPAACRRLIDRAAALAESFVPEARPTVFSTVDQRHAADAYFRESGDRIRFFLEETAVDAAGRLDRPAASALNKIGHALHDLDPVFDAFSRQPALAAMAAGLGLRRPLLLQSMYIFKQPGIGGEVGAHQDATFLHTEPVSVTGFWLALHDATVGNGCLHAYAGQHRGGLRQRFRDPGDGLRMEVVDPSPWPEESRVALEAPAGTLVVLHGLLPHASDANRSGRPRHAYALHLIDGTARYSPGNWLQRGPDLPLRGFGPTGA